VAAPAGGGAVQADALAAAPGAPPARPNNIVRTAMAMVRRGQYEGAILQCKTALRRNEKFVPAMEVLARAYFHLGKTEFADSVCDMALKLEQRSGRCYNLKGFIALKQEQGELALALFKKATDVDADYAPGWLNLGAQYLRVKNFDKAVPTLERAVQLMGNRPEAQLNLGAAYRGAGKVLKADQAFKKALRLRPGYPAAWFNLGILYLDAPQFPGMTGLQKLQTSIAYLNKYRSGGGFRDAKDPAEEYIKAAQKAMKKEERRLKREAKKRAREAEKKAGGK